MRAVRSLVVLASDNEIRLLENAGVGKGLTELKHLTRADLPDVAVEFDDVPPRVMHGNVAHAAEPRHTRAERERMRMAAHVVAEIEAALAAGGHDRLYIAAPDKMLGILRKRLPPAVAAKLAADMDKDLVKIPLIDLARHFSAIAAF
jgi:protein required for attachment to host cells